MDPPKAKRARRSNEHLKSALRADVHYDPNSKFKLLSLNHVSLPANSQGDGHMTRPTFLQSDFLRMNANLCPYYTPQEGALTKDDRIDIRLNTVSESEVELLNADQCLEADCPAPYKTVLFLNRIVKEINSFVLGSPLQCIKHLPMLFLETMRTAAMSNNGIKKVLSKLEAEVSGAEKTKPKPSSHQMFTLVASRLEQVVTDLAKEEQDTVEKVFQQTVEKEGVKAIRLVREGADKPGFLIRTQSGQLMMSVRLFYSKTDGVCTPYFEAPIVVNKVLQEEATKDLFATDTFGTQPRSAGVILKMSFWNTRKYLTPQLTVQMLQFKQVHESFVMSDDEKDDPTPLDKQEVEEDDWSH